MNFGENLKLASCGETVRIWSLPNFDLLHEFSSTSSSYFRSVSWSSDDAVVSVPTYGTTVTVTNLSTKTHVYNTVLNIKDNVSCAEFNADAKNLLLGCSSGNVISWNIERQKVVQTYTGHSCAVNCLQSNVINTHVASGSEMGEILVHNLVSGMWGSRLTSHSNKAIRHLRFSTLKKAHLASASDCGSVDVWDINSKKWVYGFPGTQAHSAPAMGVIFSPINNQLLISVGLDKKIKFYNCNCKRPVAAFTSAYPLQSLDMLDDGRTVLVGGTQGHIIVYDLRAGKVPTKTFLGHTTCVRGLAVKCNVTGIPNSLLEINRIAERTDRKHFIKQKFQSASKSEGSDKLGVQAIQRSASLSDALDGFKSAPPVPHQEQTMKDEDSEFSSSESNILSPPRDVEDLDNDGELRRLSFSSTSNSSLGDATGITVLLSAKKRSTYGVFSPPREDDNLKPTFELATSWNSSGSSKISAQEFFLSRSMEELSPIREVDLNESKHSNNGVTDDGGPFQSTAFFGPPNNQDKSATGNRWQASTGSPKLFTGDIQHLIAANSPMSSKASARESTESVIHTAMPQDQVHSVAENWQRKLSSSQENPPQPKSVQASLHERSPQTKSAQSLQEQSPQPKSARSLQEQSPQTKSAQSLQEHSTQPKSAQASLQEHPPQPKSAISSSQEQAGEPSTTNHQNFQAEFLTQLLEDKLEDFRIRMQQSSYSVLAQVVKQHVEIKEEVQVLKDSLNIQAELWDEVKKLRAENCRLRTFI